MKILVTGANGFLGQHVVEACLRQNHKVRALVRPYSNVGQLASLPQVELARADLRSKENLTSLFDGVDAVIHLAACVVGDAKAQFSSTVVGTENLLTAMASSQARHLILASSFSVYDWSEKGEWLDEKHPVEKKVYERDGYAIAKIWQERVARRLSEENGWDLTVLRPGFIWGDDHLDLAGIGQKMGRIYFVIGPLKSLPLSYVENCADCFVSALESPNSVGQTFNIIDSESISTWKYLMKSMKLTGESYLRIPVPYWLAYGIVLLVKWMSQLNWETQVQTQNNPHNFQHS